jgi:hypothetical protein
MTEEERADQKLALEIIDAHKYLGVNGIGKLSPDDRMMVVGLMQAYHERKMKDFISDQDPRED